MKSIFVILLLMATIVSSYAGSFAKEVSNETATALAIAGVLPVLTGGHSGLVKSSKYLDAQLTTAAITQLLKIATHEKRPDGSDYKSFPSGHTSAAFAMAGSLAQDHPKGKWLYIGLASLVGWSRVDLHKHHWHDVAAGAALGYACGSASERSQHGLVLGKVVRF